MEKSRNEAELANGLKHGMKGTNGFSWEANGVKEQIIFEGVGFKMNEKQWPFIIGRKNNQDEKFSDGTNRESKNRFIFEIRRC